MTETDPTPAVATTADASASHTPKDNDHHNNNPGETPAAASTAAPLTVDQALSELEAWVKTGGNNVGVDQDAVAQHRSCLELLLQDHHALKDKIGKLKSLLGRSAKAQREAKVELETTQKKLVESQAQVQALSKKVDQLATRPTHMELLADFETNFDRALLSVHPPTATTAQQQQSGGESTAGAPVALSPSSASGVDPASAAQVDPRHSIASLGSVNTEAMANLVGGADNRSSFFSANGMADSAVVDGLLMQELQDSKARSDKLESLNSALLARSSQLEADHKVARKERDELHHQVAHLELEKRMLRMELDSAEKAQADQDAQVRELQLEVDLVRQQSLKALRKTQKEQQLLETAKYDHQHVRELEQQVQALQEWATAAAEAKTLSHERVLTLEQQVAALQQELRQARGDGGPAQPRGSLIPQEATSGEGGDALTKTQKVLWEKQGSLVIGAGDWAVRVLECDSTLVPRTQRIVLQWKFDLLHSGSTVEKNLTVDFSVYQGRCESKESRTLATKANRCLISTMVVQGGGAGELEKAFFYQDACTLLWSNVKSWVRPRTVRYTVQAVAVSNPSVLQYMSFSSASSSSNVQDPEGSAGGNHEDVGIVPKKTNQD